MLSSERSVRAGGQGEDQGMVTDADRNCTEVAQGLDGRCADRGVIEMRGLVAFAELYLDGIRASHPLSPEYQEEGAIRLLQEQFMGGHRKIGEAVVEFSGCPDGSPVGKNGGQIVEIAGGFSRGIVRFVEAELLIAPLIRPVPEQVNGGMTPPPLELRQIQVHQVEGMNILRDRAANRRAGFRSNAWQRQDVLVGIPPIILPPRQSIVSIQTIHPTGRRGVGGIPRLIVFHAGGVGMVDIVVDIGKIGVLRSIRHQAVRTTGNSQKLQSHIIPLRSILTDAPDGILLQRGIALDRLIQIPLEFRHG